MDIRPASPSDAAEIAAIYNAEVTGATTTFDLVPRTLAEQLTWIDEHRGPYPAIVAIQAGEVVGFGSLSRYHTRPAYATTVEDSVYVAATARGRGIGHLLLDELVSLACAHGFHTILARIVGDNAGSVALHRSCGFIQVGVEREVGRKFGRWLDVSILQKMLGA